MPKSENIDNCKFVLFTDKDGTLDLNDESLNKILMLTRKKGGLVIPVTGRTVGDIKEEWEAKKLPLPPIIIGDNGAVIYDTKKKKFIKKCELKKDKISHIIEKFIEIEGRTDLIRYTDGEKVYASKSEKVENYYESSGKVKFISNIENEVQKGKEVNDLSNKIDEAKRPLEELTRDLMMENEKLKEMISENKKEENDEPSIKQIKIEEEPEEKRNEVDKSFFTNSLTFSKKDFEETDDFLDEEEGSSFYTKFAIFMIIIVFT